MLPKKTPPPLPHGAAAIKSGDLVCIIQLSSHVLVIVILFLLSDDSSLPSLPSLLRDPVSGGSTDDDDFLLVGSFGRRRVP
jgi:hypothetical protein